MYGAASLAGSLRHNGGMTEARPWSSIKAETYALVGRNPRSNRLVVDLADPAPDHVTLDVGCGPGAAVRAVAPLVQRAVGIDNSAAMVRIATRRSRAPNAEYHVGSAKALPFPEATFDRMWTVHAFHHWSDQEPTMPRCEIRVCCSAQKHRGRPLPGQSSTSGTPLLGRSAVSGRISTGSGHRWRSARRVRVVGRGASRAGLFRAGAPG